jgi:hypothetical protein
MPRLCSPFLFAIAGFTLALGTGCLFDTRFQAPTLLFLGNSITLHDSLPQIGWRQQSGMAATTLDSDYVHFTIRDLQLRGIRAQIEYGMRDCDVCDGPIDEHRQNIATVLRHTKPRWVVVQLGENMNALEVQTGKLTLQYRQLLFDLRAGGTYPIFCVSNWNETSLSDLHNAAIQRAMNSISGIHFVDITSVAADSQNYADTSRYLDPGVRWHPGNRGMSAMAAILSDSIANYP